METETPKTGFEKISWGLALLLALATLGFVLGSAGFYWHMEAQTPGDEDWRLVAAKVKAEFQPGDFVAILPFWATTGERYFAEADLPYRYARYTAAESWPKAARLWVVWGYDRFLDREKLLENGALPRSSFKSGALKGELFVLPEDLTHAYVLDEHLDSAEVVLRRGGQDKSCGPYDALKERLACAPQNDWQYVGRVTVQLGDSPRPALWAHPTGGAGLRLRFPAVPGGEAVVVQSGMMIYGQTFREGAPVFIDVYADGRLLGRVRQGNEDGWFSRRFSLKGLPGEVHDFEFVITTPNDGRRHFVFNGFVY